MEGAIHRTGIMTEEYTPKIVARDLLKIKLKFWFYSDCALPRSLSVHVLTDLTPPHSQFFLQNVQRSFPFFITLHSVVDTIEIATDNLFILPLLTGYQRECFTLSV